MSMQATPGMAERCRRLWRGAGRMVCALAILGAPASALTPEEIRDDVFVTLQRGTSSVAGKALQQAALRQQAGNAELAALLRQRQDLNDRRVAAQTDLSDAVKDRGAEAEARIAKAESTLAQLRDQAAALERDIEAAFPAFKELTNPRPMTVAEVQKTLAEDEVLIVTLTSDYDVFLWAISPTAADWHVVSFKERELDQQVRLLRKLLDVTQNNRAAAALDDEDDGVDISQSGQGFDRAVAHQLYTRLLAPLEPVIGDAEHLIAVLDGPLTSLPLAVLVASPPEGDDADPVALRDTDWLIDRYAMTVLPNVSSLRALRQSAINLPADDGRRPFVGFGDPNFAPTRGSGKAEDTTGSTERGYVTRGTFAKLQEVAGLAPLPNTAVELRRLARLTGVEPETALYLRDGATETAVKEADLSDVKIIAFATHGLLSGELEGLPEPALAFTPPGKASADDDALLTASEAAALKMSADLIILSACNTAAGDGTPGAEGLSGLARAFIYAGARSILVSHWPVDDFATSQLTTGMVAEMQAGRPRAEALRSSIQNLRGQGNGRYAHPRFWAPFILVGDG